MLRVLLTGRVPKSPGLIRNMERKTRKKPATNGRAVTLDGFGFLFFFFYHLLLALS